MGAPLMKKLAIAIAIIDLMMAVNDSRNVGRFFLLLTMSNTFDVLPENVIPNHCQQDLKGSTPSIMCCSYAHNVLERNVAWHPEMIDQIEHKSKSSALNVSVAGTKGQVSCKWPNLPQKEGARIEELERKDLSGSRVIHRSKRLSVTMSPKGHEDTSVSTTPKESKQLPEQIEENAVNVFENKSEPVGTGRTGTVSTLSESTKPTQSTSKVSTKGGKLLYRVKSHRNPLSSGIDDFLNSLRHHPKILTRFLDDEILLRWKCLLESIHIHTQNSNTSAPSSAVMSEHIKLQIQLHLHPELFSESKKRTRAVQQLLYDYPWMTMMEIHSELPGSFTRLFMVITIYTWVWGTLIALILLLGALTDDQTTLHGWIIFNILYSLLLFMVDDWIQTNIAPTRPPAAVWLFLIYSVYKPATAWIGFTQWSKARKSSTLILRLERLKAKSIRSVRRQTDCQQSAASEETLTYEEPPAVDTSEQVHSQGGDDGIRVTP